ncbi:unnamed protein product [Calypogeia fissa]
MMSAQDSKESRIALDRAYNDYDTLPPPPTQHSTLRGAELLGHTAFALRPTRRSSRSIDARALELLLGGKHYASDPLGIWLRRNSLERPPKDTRREAPRREAFSCDDAAENRFPGG